MVTGTKCSPLISGAWQSAQPSAPPLRVRCTCRGSRCCAWENLRFDCSWAVATGSRLATQSASELCSVLSEDSSHELAPPLAGALGEFAAGSAGGGLSSVTENLGWLDPGSKPLTGSTFKEPKRVRDEPWQAMHGKSSRSANRDASPSCSRWHSAQRRGAPSCVAAKSPAVT